MPVLRNATTDSPWPISNNPYGKYNERERPDSNLNFPLWQLVRASTAAPTYFPPEVIKNGRYSWVFVDGGMTMYNNPAFQLFLMGTLDAYRLSWPIGEDKILLVSIGTGSSAEANANLAPHQMNLLYNASSIPSALMYAASGTIATLDAISPCLAAGATKKCDGFGGLEAQRTVFAKRSATPFACGARNGIRMISHPAL